MVTFYPNIYSEHPEYIELDAALQRIRFGKSALLIDQIRKAPDKAAADAIKKKLPAVCFSGTFAPGKRLDSALQQHSGYLVLDFDDVPDIEARAGEVFSQPFVYAGWLSPRGNGLKALVKIADPTKHRQHFDALKEIFPEVDKSGVNESRVCYESYDPGMYINRDAVPFTRLVDLQQVTRTETVSGDQEIFKRLLQWLTKKRGAFVKGERNTFIFKLASACCRFGLGMQVAANLILSEFPASNDFTIKECGAAIHSGYRANKAAAGTARFENEVLVDARSRSEVEIDTAIFDQAVRPRDVIYAADVRENALRIHNSGYASVLPVGIPQLDKHFRLKRGEITCLTGIGNAGKSSFWKWYMFYRVMLFGEKFAVFGPEDNPPEEFYHDFVEIYLGQNCTPENPYNPTAAEYAAAYDFIGRYIFYVYPKDLAPTPDYIKERFLELIIKEKVDGCLIDPFNQLSHDYHGNGGRTDQYLETVLGDLARFAQTNNVYMTIIAHPNKLRKQEDNNYPCPDVFDLAGGAMWNNKMDNILVYHRPFMQTTPDNPLCEFHSKKIRRQKTVGIKGFIEFSYNRKARRYEFNNIDYLADLLRSKDRPASGLPVSYTPPAIAATKPAASFLDMSQFQNPDAPGWDDYIPEPF